MLIRVDSCWARADSCWLVLILLYHNRLDQKLWSRNIEDTLNTLWAGKHTDNNSSHVAFTVLGISQISKNMMLNNLKNDSAVQERTPAKIYLRKFPDSKQLFLNVKLVPRNRYGKFGSVLSFLLWEITEVAILRFLEYRCY